MVLLQLPMKDILLSQRVNTTFQTVIRRSIRLQRALYLAPSFDPASQLGMQSSDVRTPFFEESRNPPFGPWKLSTFYIDVDDFLGDDGYFALLRYKLHDECHARLRPPSDYETPLSHGSWKNMLLSNMRLDHVIVDLRSKGGRHLIKSVMITGNVLTMGDVQHTLCEIYESTVASKQWRNYTDPKLPFRTNIYN